MRAIHITKNQANMKPPKESNRAITTNPKGIEIYYLPFKEFK